MKTLDKIETYKANIINFETKIKELEQIVANEQKELTDINQKYQALVVNGEVDHADELYTDIEQMEKELKAKSKRLDVMKSSLKQVIIDNCKKIQNTFAEVNKEYQLTYAHEYKAYQQLLREVDKAKEKLSIRDHDYSRNYTNISRFMNQSLRAHNIIPIEFMGGINKILPFDLV